MLIVFKPVLCEDLFKYNYTPFIVTNQGVANGPWCKPFKTDDVYCVHNMIVNVTLFYIKVYIIYNNSVCYQSEWAHTHQIILKFYKKNKQFKMKEKEEATMNKE